MPADTPWYEILGVSPFASDDHIREAYLSLVRQWHPDQFLGSPELHDHALERIKVINAAYDDVRNGPPVSGVWSAEAPFGSAHRSFILPLSSVFVRAVALVLMVMYLVVALMHAVTR